MFMNVDFCSLFTNSPQKLFLFLFVFIYIYIFYTVVTPPLYNIYTSGRRVVNNIVISWLLGLGFFNIGILKKKGKGFFFGIGYGIGSISRLKEETFNIHIYTKKKKHCSYI